MASTRKEHYGAHLVSNPIERSSRDKKLLKMPYHSLFPCDLLKMQIKSRELSDETTKSFIQERYKRETLNS